MKLPILKTWQVIALSIFLSTLLGDPAYDYITNKTEMAFGTTPEAPHLKWKVQYSVDVLRKSQDNPGLPSHPYWDRQPKTETFTSDRWPDLETILKKVTIDSLTERGFQLIDVSPI